VARFALNPSISSSNYTATIDWGDGGFGPGTLSIDGQGNYTISGTNPYESAGNFATTVTLFESDQSSIASDGNATIAYVAPTINATATVDASPVTSTTANLSVTAALPDGVESNLVYYWSLLAATPSYASATFSDEGDATANNTMVTFSQAGTYNFRATILNGDASVTSDVTVVVQPVLTKIINSRVDGNYPLNRQALAPGQYTSITNYALDQFNFPMPSGTVFTYSSGDSSLLTIDSTGKMTAASDKVGQTTVTTSAGGVSTTIPVYIGGYVDALSAMANQPVGTVVTSQNPFETFSADPGNSCYFTGYGIATIPTGTFGSPGALNSRQNTYVDFPTPVNGIYISAYASTYGGVRVFTNGVYAGTEPIIDGGDDSYGADLSNYHDVTRIEVGSQVSDFEFYVGTDNSLALGDGTPNQILQASDNGQSNLVPLYLTVPPNLHDGDSVTLSTTAADKTDVWASRGPFPGDTPLLGVTTLLDGTTQTISTHTWTYGVDYIPPAVYVGATQGSTNVGDIGFTLAAVVGGTATQPATSQPASAVKIIIVSTVDPNKAGILNNDVTNQNLQWVVGQTVDLKAVVDAPPGMALTYTWTVPPDTLYSWTPIPGTATAPSTATKTLLDANNQGNTGTSDQEVKFFWVSPGTKTVKLDVNGVKAQTTFIVAQPAATFTGTPWGKGFVAQPNALGQNIGFPFDLAYGNVPNKTPGMSFSGTVSTNAIEAGSEEIIQLERVMNFCISSAVQFGWQGSLTQAT
jgi:hypothetical protein